MQRAGLNWITIALLTLAVAACGSHTSSPTPSATASPSPSTTASATIDGEIDTLDEARAAWASSGISNYRYTITRQCFCMETYIGPFTVRVRDGV